MRDLAAVYAHKKAAKKEADLSTMLRSLLFICGTRSFSLQSAKSILLVYSFWNHIDL